MEINLKRGIYWIYWKSGGSSLAAVGQSMDGKHWLAPCNWTAPTTEIDWNAIDHTVLVVAIDEIPADVA